MSYVELIQIIPNYITMVIAVAGSIYGVIAVREARKARLLGPYFEIDRRLNKQRQDRGFLYRTSIVNTEEWKNKFERVAVTFDVLGALVHEDMVYKPIVFKIYYDAIIKTWDVVSPYINKERSERNKAESYMRDFEYLYEQAKAYRVFQGLPYPERK